MGYIKRMADSIPSTVPGFTPVPMKSHGGWTAERQRGFIEALAATGSVRLAAKAVGMSCTHVYKLRHRPDGESFAQAWDEAVKLGAERVRDVLIDQAIHGVPERVLVGKDRVVERRRFNHRTMMWLLQHHMPDAYPGGSTAYRRGSRPRWQKPEPPIEELRAEILRKVDAIERGTLRAIAADPAKRAAYELLHGPRDWAALEGPGRAG